MLKYRIGTLVEPWINKTPPIRGGVFNNPVQNNLSDSDADPSDVSAVCSCSLSFGSTLHDSTCHASCSDTAKFDVPGTLPEGKGQRFSAALPSRRNIATEAYIHQAIQAGVNENIRDYPSLDAHTQREIEKKYQSLHEQVTAGGYYQCQYREYAKELCRYISIFALFVAALISGWYWTSAALLGLFWVGRYDSLSICS